MRIRIALTDVLALAGLAAVVVGVAVGSLALSIAGGVVAGAVIAFVFWRSVVRPGGPLSSRSDGRGPVS